MGKEVRKNDTIDFYFVVYTATSELSEEELQSAIGDNTYYIEWLNQCTEDKGFNMKWLEDLNGNDETKERPVPVVVETKEDPSIPTTGWEPVPRTDHAAVTEEVEDSAEKNNETVITITDDKARKRRRKGNNRRRRTRTLKMWSHFALS